MTSMTNESEKLLDATGWDLLIALQEHARASYAELGRRVGLTPPAVADRIRRLEVAGIITGYHAAVNPAKVGLALKAIIRLQTPNETYETIERTIRARPEIVECHKITGSDCMTMTAVVASVEHLADVIAMITYYGATNSSLVLQTVVEHRAIGPAALPRMEASA
jgi:Lrp/AsnC family transcriptional regulator, leucine-responsive regulatory protein